MVKRIKEALIILIVLLGIIYKVSTIPEIMIYNSSKTGEYIGNVLNVSNDSENNLQCEMKSIAVKSHIDDKYIQFNNSSVAWLDKVDSKKDKYEIDGKTYEISKDLQLGSCLISSDFVYEQYINKESTAGKELILGNLSKCSDVNTLDLKKKGDRYLGYKSLLAAKGCLNTYGKLELYLRESVAGGGVSNSNLKDTSSKIESSMVTCENSIGSAEENTIELEELGNLKISSDNEIVYSNETGLIEIRDKETGKDSLVIGSINNLVDMTTLVETDNSNVYVSTSNKKVIVVIRNNKVYAFRFENTQGKSLIKTLGIDVDALKIKKIQQFIEVENTGEVSEGLSEGLSKVEEGTNENK